MCHSLVIALHLGFCTSKLTFFFEMAEPVKYDFEFAGLVVYRNKGSDEEPKIEYLILTDIGGGETPWPPKGSYSHINFIIYFL